MVQSSICPKIHENQISLKFYEYLFHLTMIFNVYFFRIQEVSGIFFDTILTNPRQDPRLSQHIGHSGGPTSLLGALPQGIIDPMAVELFGSDRSLRSRGEWQNGVTSMSIYIYKYILYIYDYLFAHHILHILKFHGHHKQSSVKKSHRNIPVMGENVLY